MDWEKRTSHKRYFLCNCYRSKVQKIIIFAARLFAMRNKKKEKKNYPGTSKIVLILFCLKIRRMRARHTFTRKCTVPNSSNSCAYLIYFIYFIIPRYVCVNFYPFHVGAACSYRVSFSLIIFSRCPKRHLKPFLFKLSTFVSPVAMMFAARGSFRSNARSPK